MQLMYLLGNFSIKNGTWSSTSGRIRGRVNGVEDRRIKKLNADARPNSGIKQKNGDKTEKFTKT